MEQIVISVSRDGTLTHIKDPRLAGLAAMGEVKVSRVSHVLPCHPILRMWFRWLRNKYGDGGKVASFTRCFPCRWQADLGPVGGPVIGKFFRRQKAIEAEIKWLNKNNLGRTGTALQ